MPRKLSRRVSFIVVIAVACTACELWLRLEYGLGNPPLVYRDNSYRYAFVPNQSTVRFGHLIKYNREGLRSEELDDRPRVLCLGDSVTNGGSPIDQSNTFPYLSESALRLDGKNVQFLNASSGGWGPAEEYAFLSRWGIYGSRAVVIEIGTNDFYQEAADAAVGTDPNFPDRKPVFAIQELVVSYLLPRVQALFSKSSKNDAPVLARDRLDANMRIIEAMIQFAKGRGAVVLLLWVPNRADIENNPDETVIEGRKSLGDICERNGVVLLDTRQAFAEHWNPVPFRDAIHPNESGNRIIAQVLEKPLAALF